MARRTLEGLDDVVCPAKRLNIFFKDLFGNIHSSRPLISTITIEVSDPSGRVVAHGEAIYNPCHLFMKHFKKKIR